MKTTNVISLFWLLFAIIPAFAQNTANVNGNWDDCATWGNPTTGILQNITDTKTILEQEATPYGTQLRQISI